MEFPTALLGVALGVVLMPQLSARTAADDADAYPGLLDWGLRLVLLLALPCAVALLVFPDALVAVLFHRGAFDAHAVAQTALALMRLRRRPDRAGRREDPGARLLRAPGHAHAGEDRDRVLVADAGDEPRVRAAASAMPAWRCRSSLGAMINAVWLFVGLRRGGGTRPRRAGAGSRCASCVATRAARRRCCAWAERRIDWIALGGRRRGASAGSPPASAPRPALYFGAARLRPAAAQLHAPRPDASRPPCGRARPKLARMSGPLHVRDADRARVLRHAGRGRREPVAGRSRGGDRAGRLPAARHAGGARRDRRAGGAAASGASRPTPCRCSGCAG